MEIGEFHKQFVAQTTEFPEFPVPVAARWFEILTRFPAARGKTLHDAYDDVFRSALEGGNYKTTMAALSLAQLQIRYWVALHASKRIFNHAFDYENAGLYVWQVKLVKKLESITPARRKKGKIIPETVRSVELQRWLH